MVVPIQNCLEESQYNIVFKRLQTANENWQLANKLRIAPMSLLTDKRHDILYWQTTSLLLSINSITISGQCQLFSSFG